MRESIWNMNVIEILFNKCYLTKQKLHQWCNGYHAHIDYLNHGFKSRSAQTKDDQIGIYCFSVKHTALRRMNTDWLAQNQDNVSKWGDMSICGLLLQ